MCTGARAGKPFAFSLVFIFIWEACSGVPLCIYTSYIGMCR